VRPDYDRFVAGADATRADRNLTAVCQKLRPLAENQQHCATNRCSNTRNPKPRRPIGEPPGKRFNDPLDGGSGGLIRKNHQHDSDCEKHGTQDLVCPHGVSFECGESPRLPS
jgi:hypothetical protein